MEALKSVCKDCPFRRDSTAGWLGEKRITEIISGTVLGDGYFVCHKTLGNDEVYDAGDLGLEDAAMANPENRLCAGKLVLEGRVNPWGNLSTRMAKAFDFFDGYDSIKGGENVFDSVKECIDHHKIGNNE